MATKTKKITSKSTKLKNIVKKSKPAAKKTIVKKGESLAAKKSLKPKTNLDRLKNGSFLPVERVNIIKYGVKNSPHIINLKNYSQNQFSNPNPDFSEKKINLQKTSFNANNSKISNPPKPPKIYPKKTTRLEVNLIGRKKSFQYNFKFLKTFFQLISFIAHSFRSLKKEKITKVKNEKNTNYKTDEAFTKEGVEDIFAAPSHVKFSILCIPSDWHKKVVAFAVIASIFILPLEAYTYYQDLQTTKDKILLITNHAIENLKLAEQAAVTMDFDKANHQFIKARQSFNLAQQEVDNLSALTTEIIKVLPGKGSSVNAGINLLEAGEIAAELGQILIASGNRFLNSKSIDDYYNSLIEFQADLEIVIEKFNEAKTRINNVRLKDLPEEHRQAFENVLKYLPKISSGLTDVYSINNAFLKALGRDQWQRYLILFLNNNELRGGGGFMGSFAILDIDRGKIKNLEIPGGGTYDVQGQLIPKVLAPEPLHLINTRWEFQDANWWPDFPSAAKKIQWFYQNTGGPTTDGVIAITSTVMEKLLEIFGPITMDEYGREEINSQNFVEEAQKIVQLEYDKEENRPKQFITDMAPKLMKRIFNASGEEMKKLGELIKESLNEKHLLTYFNDEQIQKIIKNFGWSAEIKKTDGDYLSVVHTNLAGGKTDGVIEELIDHTAEIQSDGSIINTIKLIRTHTGIRNKDIFTGVQNNSYVRFYLPLGSALLEAEGFERPPEKFFKKPLLEYQNDADLVVIETDREKHQKTGTDIYNESGKTVFGNWLQLGAGETKEAVIKYRLPFRVKLDGEKTFYYSLLAQKQLGSLGSEIQSRLILNDELKILAKFPQELSSDENNLIFSDILTSDKFYGAVLVTKKYE